MKAIKIIGALLVLLSTSFVSAGDEEQPEYKLLKKEGQFEIREYDSYIVAQTVYFESKGETQGDAFRRLFNFISGNNVAQSEIEMTSPVTDSQEIEMTAPVTTEEIEMTVPVTTEEIEMTAPVTTEEIEMTSPVTTQEKTVGKVMSFVMPSRFTMKTVPQPADKRVQIKQIPARKMAVIQFSWFAGEQKKLRKSNELRRWIDNSTDYRILSKPIYAGYDAPFVPPFLKTHEMMYVVD